MLHTTSLQGFGYDDVVHQFENRYMRVLWSRKPLTSMLGNPALSPKSSAGRMLRNAFYKGDYKPNSCKLRGVLINQTKPLYPWMKNLLSVWFWTSDSRHYLSVIKDLFQLWSCSRYALKSQDLCSSWLWLVCQSYWDLNASINLSVGSRLESKCLWKSNRGQPQLKQEVNINLSRYMTFCISFIE